MNPWSKKTLNLVNRGDYLDRLMEVYPNESAQREAMQPEALAELRTAFDAKDDQRLLNTLLDLEKFPYKDSYVGFLRRKRDAIARNPKTVNRICRLLYGMGVDSVIDGISMPKEANTRRGSQFRDWAKSTFRWVSAEEFKSSTSGIVLLDANETEARDICNRLMGVGISKRPDLVAKVKRRYVVGEAKFLSSTGGNQGRAFDDGMLLASNTTGTAFKVFILDGVHWIETGSEQYKRIEHGSIPVFSVLLLSDYLRSL